MNHSSSTFLRNSLCQELLSFLLGKRISRTKEYVKDGYNKQRSLKKSLINSLSLKEYIEYHPGDSYCLLDNTLAYNAHAEVHRRLLNIISHSILNILPANVVELGSGDGRNILYLASRHPNVSFTGIDFSPESVRLAVEASLKYGISNARFIEADLTSRSDYSHLLSKSYIFSMHCLEEMPRDFINVLLAIETSECSRCDLIEPIFMLSRRGVILDGTRLLRILNRDRLHGFQKACNKILASRYTIDYIDLGLGANPINPSTLCIIQPKIA
jgi:hypothetical protein